MWHARAGQQQWLHISQNRQLSAARAAAATGQVLIALLLLLLLPLPDKSKCSNSKTQCCLSRSIYHMPSSTHLVERPSL